MCQHLQFTAQVHVHRHVDGNKVSFTAELGVQCSECGEVFKFLGLKQGISQSQPTTNINGTTARLPVTPAKVAHTTPAQSTDPAATKTDNPPVLASGVRPERVRKSVEEVRRPPVAQPSQAVPTILPPPNAGLLEDTLLASSVAAAALAEREQREAVQEQERPTEGQGDGKERAEEQPTPPLAPPTVYEEREAPTLPSVPPTVQEERDTTPAEAPQADATPADSGPTSTDC